MNFTMRRSSTPRARQCTRRYLRADSFSGSQASMELVRWGLHDRRRGIENLAPVARAWRIDALAIDDLLGALGRRTLRRHLAVPALRIDGPPGTEIEAGDIAIDIERQHRLTLRSWVHARNPFIPIRGCGMTWL